MTSASPEAESHVRPLSDDEIKKEAKRILELHGLFSVPVDPVKLANLSVSGCIMPNSETQTFQAQWPNVARTSKYSLIKLTHRFGRGLGPLTNSVTTYYT